MKKKKNLGMRIYALGGLGEVGKNCYCFETKDDMIIIDAGQKFTERSDQSVDGMIPNYRFIQKKERKISALFISHGHEDHIGAIPFFLQHIQFKKIYTTNITKLLIFNKLNYNKQHFNKNIFHLLKVGLTIITKNFRITPFSVNHSIPEALGFHIQTKDGSIIFTGDFKFDQTTLGELPSYDLLAKWGKEGVDALMSDSTNSQVNGYSKSEHEIGEQINRIFTSCKNRIIISTFASNMYRVRQIIKIGISHKRKICVIGKSMDAAVNILINLGYLKKGNWKIEPHHLINYHANEIVILCTGSQGETLAALKRIADDKVNNIKINENDIVIFSSSPIPGNRVFVNYLTNQFVKLGAKVIDSSQFESIHASGHGYKLEQQLMMNLVKPTYFIPIHGNTSMLKEHKKHALDVGIKSKNIFICQNGEVIELKNHKIIQTKTIIPAKYFFIESKTNKILDCNVNIDSNIMNRNGCVLVYCTIDKNREKIKDLIIRYFGCTNVGNEKHKITFLNSLKWSINTELQNLTFKENKINDYITEIVSFQLKNMKKIEPLVITETIIT